MSITNLQNNKHSCQETIYNHQMPNFDADKFAEWLTNAFNASNYKTQTQLAIKVGVTRATISNLMGAKPQSLTGKPSQPNPALVEKLALALNKDTDEALQLAGHAPISKSYVPAEITALFHDVHQWGDHKYSIVVKKLKDEMAFLNEVLPNENIDDDEEVIEEPSEDQNKKKAA